MLVNVERLNRFMDEQKLAAVVARSGNNFTYLSGLAYPGTLARHLDLADSPRGVYLVWPRKGEPVVVLNAIAEQLTRRDSWVKRVEVYAGYSEPPVHRLCKLLDEMSLAAQRVGFEKDYVNARDWEYIGGRLPRLAMIDCTALMNRVRWVKTPGEIALLKKGADLLDDAYLEVFPTIARGETERAVHSRLVASCIRRGANWAHGILNSDRNTVPYGGESDSQFLPGDVVRTDYVAYVQGYPGHQSRNAIMGEPSAEQRRSYGIVREIYGAAADKLRPGTTAGEVFAFVAERFGARYRPYHSMLAGHGVGAWWHQQEPVIARDNPIRLEEGMVIAMEPHVDHWHIQDMFVVRAGGGELISSKFPTDEPYVIRMD
ncbi:MAG: aminopeptidase P family protein [Alphaproteobacteria bacterium]|nr:aminopeptidase P family protein [Alphaproteobacteria bacterium]